MKVLFFDTIEGIFTAYMATLVIFFSGFLFLLQFLGEHFNSEYSEQEFLSSTEFLRFEEEEGHDFASLQSLEDKMPFLQMLQSVETSPSHFPIKEPSFQTLLRLQHLKKPWEIVNPFTENQIQTLELESCVTQDILDLHSPVKSDTKTPLHCLEVVSSECNKNQPNSEETRPKQTQQQASKPPPKRKRKRTKPTKNREEVESQRMTHIAVERNRRRQMNDHLTTLRSLMPPSYVQRVKLNSTPYSLLLFTTFISSINFIYIHRVTKLL